MPVAAILAWSDLDAAWHRVKVHGVGLILSWVGFWTLYMAFALMPLVRSCEKHWLRRRREAMSPTLPAIVRAEWSRETTGMWLLPAPVILTGYVLWVLLNPVWDGGYSVAATMPWWSAILFCVSVTLFVANRRLARPLDPPRREPDPAQAVPYRPQAGAGRVAMLQNSKGHP